MKTRTKLVAGLMLGALTIGVAAMPAQADGILLYKDSNYSGTRWDFGRGYVKYVGWDANDEASSVRVTSPARSTILYEHDNWGGRRSVEFYSGTNNLKGWNFNDITSSLK